MLSFTSRHRSTPSIHNLSPIYRQFSTSPSSPLPLIPAADIVVDHQNPSSFGSLTKWIASIAAGSSLGLIYWYSSNSNESDSGFFKNSFQSLSGWSFTVHDRLRYRTGFGKLSLPDYTSKYLFGDEFRRKVFFNYEKRIRLRSPPEKVFEYFASVQTPEGELFMRPEDLMRAIVPVFPPSESKLVREGYLSGERSPGELHCSPSEFFMLFDVNNDGLISFKEYIFFITLLSIPESSFSTAFRMFDRDNSGEIDKEEFKKVMALMRAQNRQGATQKNGFRFGFNFGGHVENGGLVAYFFGKDGTDRLEHEKFVKFLQDLKDEMLKLEFAHYDYKNRGTISAKDFALSMVASADISHLNKLINRVDELHKQPHLSDIRITFEEFKNFAELRRKLQPISLALFSYGKINGLLTREDFRRAASHVCGVPLTENVIEIIFHIFDSNLDGHLSADEFLRVLHQRLKDIAQPVESEISSIICNWYNGWFP